MQGVSELIDLQSSLWQKEGEIWGWMVARYTATELDAKTAIKDDKSYMFIFGAFHHDKNKWGKFIFFSSDNLWKELLTLGGEG